MKRKAKSTPDRVNTVISHGEGTMTFCRNQKKHMQIRLEKKTRKIILWMGFKTKVKELGLYL